LFASNNTFNSYFISSIAVALNSDADVIPVENCL